MFKHIKNLKQIIQNKLLGIIIIFLSGFLLLFSFYYLYSKLNINISLKSTQQYEIGNYMKSLIKKNNLNFKELNVKKIKITDLKTNEILEKNKIKKEINSYNDCLNLKGNEKNMCFYDYFFHKYSQFLNTKGILDKRICSQIKDIFGIDNGLYNRCIFVYSVNAGTKYLNINECNNIPLDLKIYSRERCKNNIIYAVFGKDNVIGKYLMKVKERGDGDKSSMYTQLLNKHATYIKGEIQGIELYDFDLSKFIEKQYSEYNKEIKEK